MGPSISPMRQRSAAGQNQEFVEKLPLWPTFSLKSSASDLWHIEEMKAPIYAVPTLLHRRYKVQKIRRCLRNIPEKYFQQKKIKKIENFSFSKPLFPIIFPLVYELVLRMGCTNWYFAVCMHIYVCSRCMGSDGSSSRQHSP